MVESLSLNFIAEVKQFWDTVQLICNRFFRRMFYLNVKLWHLQNIWEKCLKVIIDVTVGLGQAA